MTLFEVALSLGLVTFGIVSVAMLFPMGIKAEQLARFQIYASAKALEMVDAYNAFPTAEPSLESEAPDPWDVSTGRSNTAFDLERRLASYRFGIMPLPLDIARRLDSDGGEIQRVLDEGGYIYYSQPQATTGFMESGMPDTPPTEAQKLVFTVEGYAQSNAIAVLPWKAWPYYIPFPSPPCHGTHGREPGFSEPVNAIETIGGKRGILWEDTFDPDMRQVFYAECNGLKYGYRDHQQYHDAESAKRYCQAALWYCAKKQLQPLSYDLTMPLTGFDRSIPEADRWKLVQALRFLSHATTCLTTYFSKEALDVGVPIAPVDLKADGTLPADFLATSAKITALHDSAKTLAMLFASSYPYDWAVPRPLERTIMMDHPLIEYDLFSPPLAGTIWRSSPAQPAQQWRPVPAQPIRHIGTSLQFSNQSIPSSDPAWAWWGDGAPPSPRSAAAGQPVEPYAPGEPASFWGDPRHFTLANPFTPDERCRQLVFWAVDWMAYEDAETAPSAPVDAARYPRGAPRSPGGTSPATFSQLMSNPPFFDWQQYAHRNPEKVLAFKQSMLDKPTGFDVRALVIGSEGGASGSGKEDQNNAALFTGAYGGDRNFNHLLDRGPLPKAVRLRATVVARFNFYDLRVPAAIR
jgi:hypothetical protein